MAQLSRARDRSMHSIVATIQAEQDKAIRAPGRGVVAISGGPGTGKTVVALHRAAYLLYTDRRRYETGGVLVVGPSGVFMRYIERVLPSLGETAVALRSLGEVVDGVRATRHDEPAVADVKGSAAMAELVRRTARQQAPGQPARVPDLLARRHDRAQPRPARGDPPQPDVAGPAQPPAAARRRHACSTRCGARSAASAAATGAARPSTTTCSPTSRFLDFAAAWWPPLEAADVFGWLRDPEFLARVGDGVVGPEEQRLLTKSWADATDFSVQDIPLLDELRYAIGDVPARTDDEATLADTGLLDGGIDMQELFTAADREFAPTGRAWAPPTHKIEDDPFAHVLIDEAQDLTPMQWRMVGRRGRTASWTIVGDPAQSSWPVPAESAAARAAALEGKELHEFHLSTNYRNSSEIYAHAAAYADRVGLDVDLPTAVRSTGIEPVVPHRCAGRRARGRDPRGGRRDRRRGRRHGRHRGARRPPLRGQRLAGVLAGVRRRRAGARAAVDSTVTPSGEDRIVVLTGLDTKGLEFDGIVVVRPQEIEDESVTGRATLYVVLTRATQLLTTLG